MFGVAGSPDQLQSLRHAWAEATTESSRLAAGLELVKLGDFSPRPGLLELLVASSGGTTLQRLEHYQLRRVILAIATERDAVVERLLDVPVFEGDSSIFVMAGTADLVLARADAPMYVQMAHDLEVLHDIHFELATVGGYVLSGAEFDLYDDETTVVSWSVRVHEALAKVDAPYVWSGAPFTPFPLIDELLSEVQRTAATGRVRVRTAAEKLFAWSGVPHPPADTAVGPNTVADFEEYARRLRALPWRPGVKYFYGHDVDGGAGLRD